MLDVRHRWSKIQLVLLLLLLSSCAVVAQTKPTDRLAYMVNNFDGKSPLMVYDPMSQSAWFAGILNFVASSS